MGSDRVAAILTARHRLCLGCDGTGLNEHWHGGDLVDDFELCGACGGDGELPNVKPGRADAMADAETLRRVAPLYQPREVLGRIGHHARYAVAIMTGCLPEKGNRLSAAVELAARAAFRAVPALRGEVRP